MRKKYSSLQSKFDDLNSLNKKALEIIIVLLFFSIQLGAQEKVCLPNVWKGDVIKGTVYLESGDSLIGKFTHLTPYNDIKTTHIIYQGNKKKKEEISRKQVVAYYNKKSDELRWKVYVDKDSVHVKKNCFFDQGRFLLVIINGNYKLLKSELNYHSSISEYGQRSSNDVYYILDPTGLLMKVQVNELKAQMLSILYEEGSKEFIEKEEYSIEDMIEVLNYINSN